MEILVILPNNLGDIIMTTPALSGIRTKYPGATITFLAEKGFEGGLINNSDIDQIFLINRSRLKEIIEKGNTEEILIEFKSHLSDLKNRNFDLIINFSQHEYISYLVTWLEGKEVIGRYFNRGGNQSIDDNWSRYLYSIPFARRYNMIHVSDVYRRIADVDSQPSFCSVIFSEKELKEASQYLESIGVDLGGKEIVFFQPGAAFSTKRWPESYYVKLGRLLTAKNIQIVVSGAPAEKAYAEKISIEIGNGAFCTAGETNFRTAMANLNFADALVTGDTALMHAAAGLNVRTFSIFGSTNPVETGPYGESHYVFTSQSCQETPCFKNTCNHMSCMKSIKPEDVFSVMVGKEESVKGCCVYETSFSSNGDYKLIRVNSSAAPLYESQDAHFIKSLLDSKIKRSKYLETVLVDCRVVSDIVEDMGRLLSKYLENGNSKYISDFELRKRDIENVDGMALLWAAYINISLNSVPMLDPVKAVKESIDICNKISKMLNV